MGGFAGVVAWVLLVVLGVVNVALGRAVTLPPVRPGGDWRDRAWYEGRTRLSVATAGAAVLSSDLSVLHPGWWQILLVALPCFVVGVALGRRGQVPAAG